MVNKLLPDLIIGNSMVNPNVALACTLVIVYNAHNNSQPVHCAFIVNRSSCDDGRLGR